MDLPKRFTSAGTAISQQVSEEAALNRALFKQTEQMLTTIRSQALSSSLTAAGARSSWTRALEAGFTAAFPSDLTPSAKLQSQVTSQLQSELQELNLGEEAYSSVRTVLGSREAASFAHRDLEELLSLALGLETAPELTQAQRAALTAAGTPERLRRALAHLTKAQMLFERLSGRVAAVNWRVRLSRGLRTGYTGVSGTLAVGTLQMAGHRSKVWITRHDSGVRETHAQANGQRVDLATPFRVGDALLQYPGERSGPLAEVANCRCVVISGDK